MVYLPKNLPERLRKAGLNVVTLDGWETRGRPASTGGFNPVGVLNHHTGATDRIGDSADDLAYAKWMALTGRSDLPAPLVQLSLSLEGTVYLLAAGRSNHAGVAKASGSVAQGDGNSLYVGIEWMLSGTQAIPAAMMKAGAVLNAVLLDVLGSSVQAVSCHYNTSVTGKWDIGDPDGIPFGSARVLNVPKFRAAVQVEKKQLGGAPVEEKVAMSPTSTITLQHTSMQYSDTPREQALDADKIFSREKMLLSGTEVGGKDNPLDGLIRAAAKKHGYRLHLGRSVWVAVRGDILKPRSSVQKGYVPVIESSEGANKHTDRGIVWQTFVHKDVGKITHGCAHYLTHGRNPSDPNFILNRRLAHAIGDWARAKGKGKGVVFYAGDQNISDRTEDTFFGSPLTSAWDELKHYEDTGHGNIDVIASYDFSGRVEAAGIRALDDRELHLNTDHFLIEAEYKITDNARRNR